MKKILISITAILIVSACVNLNPYQRVYNGITLNFRSNLNDAAKIPVYPDEKAITDVLIDNPYLRKVAILYIANDSENGFYAVAGFEFAFKFTVVNNKLGRGEIPINAYNISSINEAYRVADRTVPVVLLLGPSQANQTAVTVDGYVIKVEGKDLYKNRTYVDLDLATDRLILTLLNAG